MKLIDEFKMSFRKFLIPFYQSEIKEAYGAIYEIKRNMEKDIRKKNRNKLATKLQIK